MTFEKFIETVEVKTKNGNVAPWNLNEFQKKLLHSKNHNKVIVRSSRQQGFTTFEFWYAVWFAIENPTKNVVYAVHSVASKRMLLDMLGNRADTEIPENLQIALGYVGNSHYSKTINYLVVEHCSFHVHTTPPEKSGLLSLLSPCLDGLVIHNPTDKTPELKGLWLDTLDGNTDLNYVFSSWKDSPEYTEAWAEGQRQLSGDAAFNSEYLSDPRAF